MKPAADRTRRVLIVEDQDDARVMMAELLELWGHTVVAAATGQEALAISSDFKPEVAFVNIGLPYREGWELGPRIREAIGNADVLLVALTGYATEEVRQRVRAAGFDECLLKPAPPEQLTALLEAPCRSRKSSPSSRKLLD